MGVDALLVLEHVVAELVREREPQPRRRIGAVEQDQRAARAAQVRPGDARVERQHADRHAVTLLDEREHVRQRLAHGRPEHRSCRVGRRQDAIGHARHCGRTG